LPESNKSKKTLAIRSGSHHRGRFSWRPHYLTCCRGIVGYWSVLSRQSLATNSTISNRRSRTAGMRCAICRRVAGDRANLPSRQLSTTRELRPVVGP
jgi:hypothetical protein